MSTILEKFSKVQNGLKAPKNQWNKFGKYNYRSKEDIFEAAKPLCIENGLVLTVNDSLVMIGERYYVEAVAVVTEIETGERIAAAGYAREAETKKGMDDAQVTGSTSSYAGKYALGNLFGLDDTKDPDATNEHKKEVAPAPSKKPQAKEQSEPKEQAQKPTAAKKPTSSQKPTAAKKQTEASNPEAKPQTEEAPKKQTDKQSEELKTLSAGIKVSMLKAIGEGKFVQVEKKLSNYKDGKNKDIVNEALKKAQADSQ